MGTVILFILCISFIIISTTNLLSRKIYMRPQPHSDSIKVVGCPDNNKQGQLLWQSDFAPVSFLNFLLSETIMPADWLIMLITRDGASHLKISKSPELCFTNNKILVFNYITFHIWRPIMMDLQWNVRHWLILAWWWSIDHKYTLLLPLLCILTEIK